MRITAISGWAIPTEWFYEQIEKYFKNSEINVIYPTNPFDIEEARIMLSEKPADLYLGYSLGSLWMFRHHELFPKKSIKAVLAPILAFTKEHNMQLYSRRAKAAEIMFGDSNFHLEQVAKKIGL